MKIVFASTAWEDYLHWQERDRKLLKRINQLIEESRRHPFVGTGKPEPLKGDLAGFWSRRITEEHRMVYRIRGEGSAQELQLAQLRYHYAD